MTAPTTKARFRRLMASAETRDAEREQRLNEAHAEGARFALAVVRAFSPDPEEQRRFAESWLRDIQRPEDPS